MTDVEPACNIKVRDARPFDVDGTAVEKCGTCGICFPDGIIPDDVDEVVAGRYCDKVHKPEGGEIDEHATVSDDPGCKANGLAAKIGAEDFGPEDIEELVRGDA